MYTHVYEELHKATKYIGEIINTTISESHCSSPFTSQQHRQNTTVIYFLLKAGLHSLEGLIPLNDRLGIISSVNTKCRVNLNLSPCHKTATEIKFFKGLQTFLTNTTDLIHKVCRCCIN